jgi:hypothetical protein
MDWNNYNQQSGNQNSLDATDAEFHCGLCNKAYSRRTLSLCMHTCNRSICHVARVLKYPTGDLRDRHRRRCAKTFGRERTSKRKSCDTCAQTKLRCSLTRPACSRCVQIGTTCRYPNANPSPNTSSASPSGGGEDAGAEHVSPMGVNLESTSTGPNHVVPISAITLPADSSNSAPSIDGIAWSPVLNNFGFGLDGTGFSDTASAFIDYLHGQTSYLLTPQEKSKAPQALDDHSLLLSGDQLNVSLPPLSSSAGSTHRRSSAGRENAEIDMINMFASSFVPDLSHSALRDTTSLSEELFGILREYPRMMLQPNFWSPFIHHRLYRCSKDGMAEPLGIALACVSAYSSSVESSFEFVDNMINAQRERLVREFHLFIDRPETCLAALHAVCIYQILGLFGGPSVDSPRSPRSSHSTLYRNGSERRREDLGKVAELHGSFLLKVSPRFYRSSPLSQILTTHTLTTAQMTRRLCRLHQKAVGQNHVGWSEWKFAESLRRNVFFVHIVNILAAEARKLHHDYFEPLNDAIIQQIPLPAPESMWRACTEAEWRAAREFSGQESPNPTALQGLLDLGRTGSLDVASLQPLTRMILACHKIRLKFNDEEE